MRREGGGGMAERAATKVIITSISVFGVARPAAK